MVTPAAIISAAPVAVPIAVAPPVAAMTLAVAATRRTIVAAKGIAIPVVMAARVIFG
jgi:hypothetical protein